MSKMTITKKNLKLLQNTSKEFDILVDTIRPLSNENNVKTMDKIQSILKLSFNNPLVLEDMSKIESLSPDLYSLSQGLDSLSLKFSQQVNNASNCLNETFKKYRESEDSSFDNKMNGFGKIQEKHKLWSVWSEYKISPSEMKKSFSDKPVESLSYESWGPTQTLKVGKITTWLEMWKVAEKVMKLSGDTHHQFIEAFVEDKKKPGHFKLVTGS